MKIALIGCGWLGRPLAQEFLKNGNTVFGSSTSPEKLAELESLGIIPFLYDGERNVLLPPAVRNVDCLIINFPPSKSENYPIQIEELLKQLPDACKVIFTSSTSVYQDLEGEVDEKSPTKMDHSVFLAEEKLRHSGKQVTILRLAGLIGPNRHPVKQLSGRIIKDGNMAVNLVHLTDVIAAIKIILDKNAWGKTYNICWHDHPKKGDYYLNAAEIYGVIPPVIQYSNLKGKSIDGGLISFELGFQYNHSI